MNTVTTTTTSNQSIAQRLVAEHKNVYSLITACEAVVGVHIHVTATTTVYTFSDASQISISGRSYRAIN